MFRSVATYYHKLDSFIFPPFFILSRLGNEFKVNRSCLAVCATFSLFFWNMHLLQSNKSIFLSNSKFSVILITEYTKYLQWWQTESDEGGSFSHKGCFTCGDKTIKVHFFLNLNAQGWRTNVVVLKRQRGNWIQAYFSSWVIKCRRT